MSNLLQNPSFEGGWTRKTWTGQEYGEIFVPEGWTFFWKEGGLLNPEDPNTTYSRPEAQVINKEAPYLSPPRIFDGYRAFKYFTFYRVHDAGIMQRVPVTPGSSYKATARAQSWFWATDDPSKIDDPYKSGHWKGGVWYDFANGHEGFDFLVGIDPLGGTDPYAASVVWSVPVRYYDEYAELPGVEAEAEATTITVFLRSVAIWPFKHCDAYWDLASLELVAEPEPEPEPCWGQPREQYVRVVNVVRQNATEGRYLEIAQIAWGRGKQTVTGSSDDAGMGPLNDKTAVEWDVPPEQRQAYVDFYATYYPGTKVKFDGVGGTDVPEPEDPNEPTVYPLRSDNLVGLHSSFIGALTMPYITQSLTTVQKGFSAGDVYRYKQAAPDIITVWRKYVSTIPQSTPQGEAQWYLDQYSAEIDAAAKAMGISVGTLLSGIDGIESANEVIGSNALEGLKRAVEVDCYFADLLYARYGDALAPVLLNVAVGNPLESEVEYLLPAAQEAERYGGFLGYHSYWSANTSTTFIESGWPYHAGRWMEWDKVFTAAGCYPRYIATEGGICYASDGWNFDPMRGWRACGAFSKYIVDIAEYADRALAWNDTHGNRCAGITLFCAYQWGWDSFLIGDTEIRALIDWSTGTYSAQGLEARSTPNQRVKEYVSSLSAYLRQATYLMPEDRERLESELSQARRQLWR